MVGKRLVVVLSVVLLLGALAGCGGLGDGATVKVSPSGTISYLTAIEVTPTNPSLAIGTSQQFTVTGIYSDNTTLDVTASTLWISSDTTKVTMSSSGLATAVGVGSAVITARIGGVSNTNTVTVTGAALVSIAVSPTNPSIAKGTTQQFTATGTFSDNTTQDLTASVTWTSGSPSTASISNAAESSGLATTLVAGSSVISAASGSITGVSTLTVTPATLVSLAITPTNPSIALGATQQFTATGTYSDGTTQNLTAAAIWSSSNTGTATVSNTTGSKGLVTPVAVGSSTITAISGGVSATTTLTVTPATLVSIAITPLNPSVAKGATQQFTATGTYSDNSTQNLTGTVTWSSSNTGVATISNAQGSKGLATGVNTGTSTVSAVSGSVSKSVTLTVTSNTVTLTWDAPTQYADGSALNAAADLQSYKIYYGTASRSYTQSTTIANPGTASVTQTLTLSPGSYFFVVTAITKSGEESDYSNEILKSL